MSEYLAAAAENMGMPESLVMRSATAKAKAQGVTVEDLLREWAGGEAAEAPASASVEPDEAPATAAAPAPSAPAPAPAAAVATVEVRKLGRKDPDAAPLLVAPRDSHGRMLLTILGILIAGAVMGALLPTQAARQAVNESVGTQIEYSDLALAGRAIYLAEGCAACHTMVVRATATDLGLGPVTAAKDVAPLAVDTIGLRRIGPDLAHVGSREPTNNAEWLVAFLRNPASVDSDAAHPRYSFLPAEELDALAAFLIETK